MTESVWKPIATAPRNATHVLLVVEHRGARGIWVAHWADGGGEDQPMFGPAWFYGTGYDFCEIPGKATHWAPVPEMPK